MSIVIIETKVRDVVSAIARQDLTAIGPDDDLVAALGVDSLQGLQILATVEKRFDIRLPDEELIRMRTIRAIVEGVERQQTRRAS